MPVQAQMPEFSVKPCCSTHVNSAAVDQEPATKTVPVDLSGYYLRLAQDYNTCFQSDN